MNPTNHIHQSPFFFSLVCTTGVAALVVCKYDGAGAVVFLRGIATLQSTWILSW
jgi:hypothetical protein